MTALRMLFFIYRGVQRSVQTKMEQTAKRRQAAADRKDRRRDVGGGVGGGQLGVNRLEQVRITCTSKNSPTAEVHSTGADTVQRAET